MSTPTTSTNGNVSQKKIGSGPKTRVCYICGRQYGLHSFEIHLKQCKDLWVAREETKDPRERKPLPTDPLLLQQSEKEDNSKNVRDINATTAISGLDLDRINQMASEAFKSTALSRCEYCDRTFLPEKLIIHHRSCTAEHPARRVVDGVRAGKEILAVKLPPDNATSLRARTPSSILKREPNGIVATASAADSDSQLSSRAHIQINEDTADKQSQRVGVGVIPAESTSEAEADVSVGTITKTLLSPPPIAGAIGGSAGRRIRSSSNTAQTTSHMRTEEDSSSCCTGASAAASRKDLVAQCTRRLHEIENMARGLLVAVEDMKTMLATVDKGLDMEGNKAMVRT